MATTKKTTHTTVFNLIILDESGSMSPLKASTIEGCNSTLDAIRQSAKDFPNLRQFASIYAFQSGNPKAPSRYLIRNTPIDQVGVLTEKNYVPWGGTPLLDAVGSTLTELEHVAATHEDATGIVTIITDGEENSSTDFTWEKVSAIISRLKEMGWTINLIGANIDVEQMGKRMSIDDTLSFEATPRGNGIMLTKLQKARTVRMNEYNDIWESNQDASVEKLREIRKEKVSKKDFFSE